jgi:hypothetical protein
MAEIDVELPIDYRLTEGEIDNIVYLTCKYTVCWSMREVDKTVCKMMAGDGLGIAYLRKLVRVTCEYVWDHISGEPEEPTQEQLYDHMAPILTEWFKTSTQAERSNTK